MEGYTEWQLGGRPHRRDDAEARLGAGRGPASMWMVYFAVDDADAAVARVTELGGAVMMGPMDIEPGRFAVVSDPSGAVFSVMKMKAPTPSHGAGVARRVWGGRRAPRVSSPGSTRA